MVAPVLAIPAGSRHRFISAVDARRDRCAACYTDMINTGSLANNPQTFAAAQTAIPESIQRMTSPEAFGR